MMPSAHGYTTSPVCATPTLPPHARRATLLPPMPATPSARGHTMAPARPPTPRSRACRAGLWCPFDPLHRPHATKSSNRNASSRLPNPSRRPQSAPMCQPPCRRRSLPRVPPITPRGSPPTTDHGTIFISKVSKIRKMFWIQISKLRFGQYLAQTLIYPLTQELLP
jgi:hypothetical protein